MGGKQVGIVLGDSKDILKSGDTLQTGFKKDFTSTISAAIDPLMAKISHTLAGLDTVLHSVAIALNKNDPKSTIGSLNASLANIEAITHDIEASGSLNKSLKNIESITTNINNNNANIDNLLKNLGTFSDNLKDTDLKTTINNATEAIASLQLILNKINKGEGTVGKLVKDEQVYQRLDSPALRPADGEHRTIPCKSDGDCRDDARAAPPGTQCVGHLQADPARACTRGDDCVERRCVAAWFATCAADPDTTGPQGYCVDARWSGKGVAACCVNQDPYYICEGTGSCEAEDFADPRRRQGEGSRMSLADSDGDGRVEAIEACRDTLGGGDRQICDPLFQPGVAPVARHDRLETLPTPARSCICEDAPAAGCQEFVDSSCREGGDKNRPISADRRGEYAIKFVTRPGGVVDE